ncbi:hypothetical protein I4U23_012510 [Adineta vaga]|nr:hypothetical protein I4U23_012510 [Adineta vaga]
MFIYHFNLIHYQQRPSFLQIMHPSYRFIFVLLSMILCFQFAMTYPSSYAPRQRGFLLCHLSAVACKRDLTSEEDMTESSSTISLADYLQTCISSQKSLRYCLQQPLYHEIRQIN